MHYAKHLLFFIIAGTGAFASRAQQPFSEGIIEYTVLLTAPDKKKISGTYTMSFKGAEIKKVMKMDNGYEDITLFNCKNGTIHSLQSPYGNKYAIQLSMEEFKTKQEKYTGYKLNNEKKQNKTIDGLAIYQGTVKYKNNTKSTILYTKEWKPSEAITYTRFPNATFLPLRFEYNEDNGMGMVFEATKISAVPLSNSIFRIPSDYKMISFEEYKQLSQ
jgi:hypothetical protein